jgi:hypothetical protein
MSTSEYQQGKAQDNTKVLKTNSILVVEGTSPGREGLPSQAVQKH